MWEAQAGRCALSGDVLTFQNAEFDHAVPLSRGGIKGLDNLRWVTREANRAKGRMTDDEFAGLCSKIVEWLARRIAVASE